MYKAITLASVSKSEPYKLYDFISNELAVYVDGEHRGSVHIDIPAEWIYYLIVCKLKASCGEVKFLLIRLDDSGNQWSLSYMQGDSMPATMNVITKKHIKEQAEWVLNAIKQY